MPWSTALRVPTSEGPVWFKASGPGTAHEGPLPDEMDGHGDAIAGWLVEFAERLDGASWRR